jgi:hypothetical protein
VTFWRVANFVTIVLLASGVAPSQQPKPDAVPDSGAVIRTETKVVLVDTVVTDKKGNYFRNVTAKDFRVREDNKAQTVKTFSFESEPESPKNAQKRYLVLFFDNSTMGPRRTGAGPAGGRETHRLQRRSEPDTPRVINGVSAS